MATTTRWGILATGSIAHQFAQGLADADGAELIAVGSRSADKAEAFGREFAVPNRHGSYEALARDEDVDVVYIATPHPQHKPNALLCIAQGKAVLCEKPFTVNAGEAGEVVAAARDAGVFCMEAMWTRFLPALAETRRLIADGAIGDVRMVRADFGFRCDWDPQSRLLKADLGGGGLLDVGVYCVSLASMVFGGALPQRAAGLAAIGATGVDEQAGYVLDYGDGRLAVLASAVRTDTPKAAEILGTEGRIELAPPFFKSECLTLATGGKSRTIKAKLRGNGYNYQAEEVARCFAEGLAESPIMPLDETLTVMETLDTLRRQWNLSYPMESA
ncbi:MAG: Gfo/Idh/MocA family oxidoreductase [Phycisphaerae bacterium]|nr:Gfo/Idh/MocA family oxidoreductase [Phycisphaerae bacterium]